MQIEAVLRSRPEGPVHVSGFIVQTADGARLCSELLESFPPQCGGPSLALRELDADALPDLLREGGTFWTSRTVHLTGTLSGDVLTVTAQGA